MRFDAMDLKILSSLQANARLSNVELSEQVHLSASQCYRRLKRMEDAGIVRGYTALLEPEALGFGVMAHVNVSLEKHGDNPVQAFSAAIHEYPEVLECHAVSGDADYVLRVVAPDLKAFSDFLMHRLLALPFIATVRSSIFLDELKNTTELPLQSVEPVT